MVYVYKGNKKQLPDENQPLDKPQTQKRKVAQCGEYSGYLRHIKDKEKACLDCRIAYSEYRGFEGRLHNMEEPACGTERGYKRHRYKKEPIDDACKKAHSKYTADARKKAKAKYRND